MRALITCSAFVLMHAALAAGQLRTLLILVACVSGAALALRTTMTTLSRETCMLCCETVFSLRMHPRHAANSADAAGPCGQHRCCASCWQRYLRVNEDSLIDRLRRRRSPDAITCWGCDRRVERSLLQRFAPPNLLGVAHLTERREEYVRRGHELGFGIIDCPRCGLGVAYDDGQQRTAMCFLCEHQWEHSSSRYGGWSAFSEWLASLWPQRIRGVSDWRPCPHCGAAIQKEGGCPMM